MKKLLSKLNVIGRLRQARREKQAEKTLHELSAMLDTMQREARLSQREAEINKREKELEDAEEAFEEWLKGLATNALVPTATSIVVLDPQGTSDKKSGLKKGKTKLDEGLEKIENVKTKRKRVSKTKK